MKARTLASVIGLEFYALALATMQHVLVGVRTDEAKYLLDIPYPHPPFARFILGLTDGWMYQELLWRIVFATLLVQGVWLALSLVSGLSRPARAAVAAGWLLSSPLVLQAGTVMMAPLTAMQALVCVWLLFSPGDQTYRAWLIGLFWLFMLFTAYQAVLFFPVVFAVVWRMRLPASKRLMLFLVPVALLCFYTLINPLALASMVLHAEKDAVQTIAERLRESGFIFLLGGSGILSLMGVVGLLFTRRVSLFLSFLLVAAYVFLGRYDYYAVLFLPLLAAGLVELARRMPRIAVATAALVPVGTLLILVSFPWLVPVSGMAPEHVMRIIEEKDQPGDILIVGPFGHDWQYVSRRPVRRYQARFLAEAAAVICLRPCEEMQRSARWGRVEETPVEFWVEQP